MSRFDSIVMEWLDVSVEATKGDYSSQLEPFETYKEKVKLKGLRAFNDYLNSIEHGYQVIIDKLEEEFK